MPEGQAAELSYTSERALVAAEVAGLYARAGLRRPNDDLPRIQAMLDHADLTFSAWDGDKLVGVCRSLTDWRYICYLSDLAVEPDYQGRGIGQELIRLTRERLGPEVMVLLLAAPGAASYYPHIGFAPQTNGWSLARER